MFLQLAGRVNALLNGPMFCSHPVKGPVIFHDGHAIEDPGIPAMDNSNAMEILAHDQMTYLPGKIHVGMRWHLEPQFFGQLRYQAIGKIPGFPDLVMEELNPVLHWLFELSTILSFVAGFIPFPIPR